MSSFFRSIAYARTCLGPDIRARLEQQAFLIESSTPETLTTTIAEDFKLWQSFVRENDIPLE